MRDSAFPRTPPNGDSRWLRPRAHEGEEGGTFWDGMGFTLLFILTLFIGCDYSSTSLHEIIIRVSSALPLPLLLRSLCQASNPGKAVEWALRGSVSGAYCQHLPVPPSSDPFLLYQQKQSVE